LTTPRAPDAVQPLTAWETLSGEVIDALKTPFVCGMFELDLAAAHALRSRLRESGEEVSDTTVVLAAVGRVLATDPTLHTIQHRGRRIVPGSVDIGVSVGGHGPLAPVTVVRGVEGKGLLQIQREVRAGSREALRAEKRDMERARAWRLIPGPLRRLGLRLVLGSAEVRRRLVGTFQVSSLDAFSFDIAITPVAAAPLLMVGCTQPRPVAVGGVVGIRPRAWAALHADHRLLNGATGGRFKALLQDALDHPERLLDQAGGEGPGSSAASSSSAASASAT
jgi:pyruvate/2-oxoglutarate dehydrogenase complex dihydrolipoamide acyltransferase (E2) component